MSPFHSQRKYPKYNQGSPSGRRRITWNSWTYNILNHSRRIIYTRVESLPSSLNCFEELYKLPQRTPPLAASSSLDQMSSRLSSLIQNEAIKINQFVKFFYQDSASHPLSSNPIQNLSLRMQGFNAQHWTFRFHFPTLNFFSYLIFFSRSSSYEKIV